MQKTGTYMQPHLTTKNRGFINREHTYRLICTHHLFLYRHLRLLLPFPSKTHPALAGDNITHVQNG